MYFVVPNSFAKSVLYKYSHFIYFHAIKYAEGYLLGSYSANGTIVCVRCNDNVYTFPSMSTLSSKWVCGWEGGVCVVECDNW